MRKDKFLTLTVYVAGPIRPHGEVLIRNDKNKVRKLGTQAEHFRNIARGVRWSLYIWKLGFIPYNPFLDFSLMFLCEDIDEFECQKISDEWLKRCDIMFVIPNENGYTKWQNSDGVARELEIATKNGIPTCFSIKELQEITQKDGI